MFHVGRGTKEVEMEGIIGSACATLFGICIGGLLVWMFYFRGRKTKDRRRSTQDSEEMAEVEVREVEGLCRQSLALRKCVAWLVSSVENDAVRGISSARTNDRGYDQALSNYAGQVRACGTLRALWDSVSMGEMADGMKAEREREERRGVDGKREKR